MKDSDLYHARRLGQHRRFFRVVRPGMVLLTEREDGSYRRELVRTGFSSPSDGLLWFPDLRDHTTLSLLEGVVFGTGPKSSLPLEELVDRALSRLDAPEPDVVPSAGGSVATPPVVAGSAVAAAPATLLPSTAPPSPAWTSASVEPPEGVRVLVCGGKTEEDRWFSVARRERLRAFVGDERVPTGPWTLTWYDPMEGVRIAEESVRYWMPIPELPSERT